MDHIGRFDIHVLPGICGTGERIVVLAAAGRQQSRGDRYGRHDIALEFAHEVIPRPLA